MAYEFKLPDIGEGVVEGEIVRWLIQPGVRVEEDQPMVEVMTDKANVEIPSPVAGTIVRIVGREGETVRVGEVMVVINGEEDDSIPPAGVPGRAETASEPETAATVTKELKPAAGRVLATPAVRKKARELGIDLATIAGTGPSGRITFEDLERKAAESADRTQTAVSSESGLQDSIPYRGIRREIGNHLYHSQRTAVHYTFVEEVDATELVRLRKACLADERLAHLTYLPFILKAVVSGLKQYPVLNASLDEGRQEILLKRHYNIGIATATDQGLVVPVIRNVDGKSIGELSAEMNALVERTRKGEADLNDLRDGTFTVTSLGPLGGLLATPVINYPEVAILGIHKIRPMPVVRDGQIVISQMMNLSITADHRVVDGAVAAEFIHHVIRILEHPGLLAL